MTEQRREASKACVTTQSVVTRLLTGSANVYALFPRLRFGLVWEVSNLTGS